MEFFPYLLHWNFLTQFYKPWNDTSDERGVLLDNRH